MPMYRVTFQGVFMDRHFEQLEGAAGVTYDGYENAGPPQPAGSRVHKALIEADSSGDAARMFEGALGANFGKFGNIRVVPA